MNHLVTVHCSAVYSSRPKLTRRYVQAAIISVYGVIRWSSHSMQWYGTAVAISPSEDEGRRWV